MGPREQAEEFIFSFLLPHGGTDKPPRSGTLYAGRYEGRPALFSFGSYHLLAVRQDITGWPTEQMWTGWYVNTDRPTRDTAMHLNALHRALERCNYKRSDHKATITDQNGNFEFWYREDV